MQQKYVITLTIDSEEFSETLWALHCGAGALEESDQEDKQAKALRLKALQQRLLDAPTKVIEPRLGLVEVDGI